MDPGHKMLLFQVAVPLSLLAWLAWGREASRPARALKAIGVIAYVLYLALIGRWDWLGHLARPVLLSTAALALGLAVIRSRGRPRTTSPRPGQRWQLGILGVVAATFVGLLVWTAIGRLPPSDPFDAAFPLGDGRYYVAHGGRSVVLNHHWSTRSQAYALDIVKLGEAGRRARGLWSDRLEDFEIFGDTVLSPVDGWVARAVDDHPDLPPGELDPSNPSGNHIILGDEGQEVAILLAHLQQGSLLVEEGAAVERGQPLARVGNSGNTTEPHLHIHALEVTPEEGRSRATVPMTFEGRFLVRNDVVDSAAP